jgi:putative ATP-dependent endonuclease of OLD family
LFFSAPLDLDLEMLRAYPQAYKSLESRGPAIPDSDDPKLDEKIASLGKAVLGDQTAEASLYTAVEKSLFWAYRYHFLSRSKPSTHLLALNTLSDQAFRDGCPPHLRALVQKVSASLQPPVLRNENDQP